VKGKASTTLQQVCQRARTTSQWGHSEDEALCGRKEDLGESNGQITA